MTSSISLSSTKEQTVVGIWASFLFWTDCFGAWYVGWTVYNGWAAGRAVLFAWAGTCAKLITEVAVGSGFTAGTVDIFSFDPKGILDGFTDPKLTLAAVGWAKLTCWEVTPNVVGFTPIEGLSFCNYRLRFSIKYNVN